MGCNTILKIDLFIIAQTHEFVNFGNFDKLVLLLAYWIEYMHIISMHLLHSLFINYGNGRMQIKGGHKHFKEEKA